MRGAHGGAGGRAGTSRAGSSTEGEEVGGGAASEADEHVAVEGAEQSGQPTIFLLLDWEKAFDRVRHEALTIALERMKVPAIIVNHIIHILSSLFLSLNSLVEPDVLPP